MGSGINKENNDIVNQNLLFKKVEDLIKIFDNHLIELEQKEFDTMEELNSLELKINIDNIQNSINEELINLRKKIKEMTDNKELNSNQKRLNIINDKIQNLYVKYSEIIKNKIKPFD
jgi:hypothetical protein